MCSGSVDDVAKPVWQASRTRASFARTMKSVTVRAASGSVPLGAMQFGLARLAFRDWPADAVALSFSACR